MVPCTTLCRQSYKIFSATAFRTKWDYCIVCQTSCLKDWWAPHPNSVSVVECSHQVPSCERVDWPQMRMIYVFFQIFPTNTLRDSDRSTFNLTTTSVEQVLTFINFKVFKTVQFAPELFHGLFQVSFQYFASTAIRHEGEGFWLAGNSCQLHHNHTSSPNNFFATLLSRRELCSTVYSFLSDLVLFLLCSTVCELCSTIHQLHCNVVPPLVVYPFLFACDWVPPSTAYIHVLIGL